MLGIVVPAGVRGWCVGGLGGGQQGRQWRRQMAEAMAASMAAPMARCQWPGEAGGPERRL